MKSEKWDTWTELDDSGKVVDGGLKFKGKEFKPYLPTARLEMFTKDWLDKNKYGRWIYIIQTSDNLASKKKIGIKVGECTTDFLGRYENITGMTYNQRVIEVFPSNVGDREIHKWLGAVKIEGVTNNQNTANRYGSEEVYEVEDRKALTTLIERVHEYARTEEGVGPRKEQKLYKDISELGDWVVGEIYKFISKYGDYGKTPHINLSLCPRYGKTNTAIATWLKTGARIMVMASYVATVTNSYADQVLENKGYENILIVDTTTEKGRESLAKVDAWLDADHDNRVLFLVPLTGTGPDGEKEVELDDTTWNTRTEGMVKCISNWLKKDELYVIVVDECDFGAHCKKQRDKILSISEIDGVPALYKMSLSGTNAMIAENIWGKPDIVRSIGYLEMEEIVKKSRITTK